MKIEVNANSSIRIQSNQIIYFDPFRIERESHDADLIFLTHDHYDHFSPEDIGKVEKSDTVFVAPLCMKEVLKGRNAVLLKQGEAKEVSSLEVRAIASYNVFKPFHPKRKGYLGYVVTIEGKRVYVAGDCDVNEDNRKVKCEIALLPIGGTFTMDYKQAAGLINEIVPELAIPTHYGDVAGDKKDGERFRQRINDPVRVELLLH